MATKITISQICELKNDGQKSPSFLFLIFACFFQNIQQRFVLLTAVRTQIQMFADQWHEFSSVFLVHFSFYILVNPGIDLITWHFLFPHTFEHAQESKNCVVGKFLMIIKAVSNLLDNGTDVHN